MGFGVKGLAILWNQPEGQIRHMLLLAETGGKRYIADVGFGGLGPTGPLLLKPGIEQKTPHESYRLKRKGDEYILESYVKKELKPLYRFNLDEHYLQDYEITNWYLSNHPESHFVTGLIAARPEVDPNRRYALHGNELSIHTIGKDTKKRTLQTVAELKGVLKNNFRINLTDLPGLDKKLKELF
jgi:N-hydroxyarylamine O-acetyltransferase